MVAPLIAGAARATLGKSAAKKSTKSPSRTTAANNTRSSRIVEQRRRNLEKKSQEQRTAANDNHPVQPKAKRRIPKILRGLIKGGHSSSNITVTKKRIKLILRATRLIPFLLTPLIIQLIAALIAMAAIGVESVSWLTYAFPGVFIFKLAWFIVFLASSIIMIPLGFTFADQFLKKDVAFVFFGCLMASWAPYFFLVPWSIIWILYIVKIQE